MTKPIGDYTVDELSSKIQAIKAERERTADALKRYEEELEHRKQEVPLGVPLESFVHGNFWDNYSFCFASEESKLAFSIRLNDYVKSLQKLAKGKPIDIQVLLPLLKKGWVAMDKDDVWFWYENKPYKGSETWCPKDGSFIMELYSFNIKPANNWEDSLMDCGL